MLPIGSIRIRPKPHVLMNDPHSTDSIPKRCRYPRVSLRSLFLIILIVASLLASWRITKQQGVRDVADARMSNSVTHDGVDYRPIRWSEFSKTEKQRFYDSFRCVMPFVIAGSDTSVSVHHDNSSYGLASNGTYIWFFGASFRLSK